VLVDSINGVIDDYYPSISPDGQTLLFTTGNRIRMSHWTGTTWSSSVDLGNNVNSGQRQVKATITPDNRTLYFTSWKDGGYGSYDIWKSEWQDSCQCWGTAEVMPLPINSDDMEWDVQLSHDGKKMYFSSNRLFGWGDLDIWCSNWNDSTNNWGDPYNLGTTINSSTRDYGAYPTSDDLNLYFASWGPHHFEPPRWLGPVDLFIAYNHGGEWDSIDILPPPIMTGYWELSPAITNDGLTMLFSSSRPGGPGPPDIYVTHYSTAIDEPGENPREYSFSLSAYPNPFNSATMITITGAKQGMIAIYDIAGRKICVLNAQNGKAIWDAAAYSSGLYFAVTEIGKQSLKITLLR
jgi:hypothetical protein